MVSINPRGGFPDHWPTAAPDRPMVAGARHRFA